MRKTSLYIVIILTIGLLPSWIQYGGFMMVGDFLTQILPFIVETKRMFASGVPFWSWNTNFGDNFIASYSYYTVTNPFVWINCLFPLEYIYESITFTLYLKFLVIGSLCYLFFKEIGLKKESCCIGALLFSFASFSLIVLTYYMFLEPIICFLLLLFSIERYLTGKKYGTILVYFSSFLVIFINFYFAPCTFFPAFIYFVFRVRSLDKSLFHTIVAISPIIILGALTSVVILLPTILHLIGGPRTEMFFWKRYSFEDRLHALFVPRIKDGIIPLTHNTSWTGTAAYIPIFGCCLAFLYCIKRKTFISYTLLTLLSLYLTPFNGIFSLFTNPEYTRWIYALVFFIVLASVKYLEEYSLSVKSASIYIFTGIIVLLIRYAKPITLHIINHIPFSSNDKIFTIIVLALYFVSSVLLLIYSKAQHKRLIIPFISLVAIFNLMSASFVRSDYYIGKIEKDSLKKDVFSRYIKNNTLSYETQQKTYRTDFLTRAPLFFFANVALLKNIPSVNTYHSVMNEKIYRLGTTTSGKSEVPECGFLKDCNETTFNCLMSVKEIIQYKDPYTSVKQNVPASLCEENEYYKRFVSKYYIPFGFTYKYYIEQEELDKINLESPKQDIPQYMLNAVSIHREDVPELGRYLLPCPDLFATNLDSIVSQRSKTTAQNMEWTTKGFCCTMNSDKENLVFFSVPADSGFTATIDGANTKIYEVNFGLSGILVPEGEHVIEFSYFPPGLLAGALISIISFLLYVFFYEVWPKLNHRNDKTVLLKA